MKTFLHSKKSVLTLFNLSPVKEPIQQHSSNPLKVKVKYQHFHTGGNTEISYVTTTANHYGLLNVSYYLKEKKMYALNIMICVNN